VVPAAVEAGDREYRRELASEKEVVAKKKSESGNSLGDSGSPKWRSRKLGLRGSATIVQKISVNYDVSCEADNSVLFHTHQKGEKGK
jgi:hypothetical protein